MLESTAYQSFKMATTNFQFVLSVLHITFTVFACRRSQIQYGCGAFRRHLEMRHQDELWSKQQ